MSNEIRFDGKVVVVTGAGSGLGRSHALEFARRGAKVVVNDLGGSAFGDGANSKAADDVVAEIQEMKGEAVANYDSVENGDAIIQTAIDNFDRVDIVINNAGILRDVSFAKMTDQDWDLIYKVHTLGAYKVTKAAWSHMQEQGFGRIVNTASAAGLFGNFGQANYASAKLGLVGFTQTLAQEGLRNNIHVNAIAPLAGSRLTETILPKEIVDALKPELVTPLVVKLCAENNEETGSVFEVGAGWISKLRWQRTEGEVFDATKPLTPEMINDKWDSITDFSEPNYPNNIQDSFSVVLKNLGIELPKG